jgi:hypothetical protein
MKVFQQIATSFQAWANCINSDVLCAKWEEIHESRILDLVKERLPSGSGFNSGTRFDFDTSTPEKLVFVTSFHHMNEAGYYDGWTEHKVIVTPSLAHGFTLKVSGRDRNQIKDYIGEVFNHALRSDC